MKSKHEPLQEFDVGEKDLSYGKQPIGKSVVRLKDESVHLNQTGGATPYSKMAYGRRERKQVIESLQSTISSKATVKPSLCECQTKLLNQCQVVESKP